MSTVRHRSPRMLSGQLPEKKVYAVSNLVAYGEETWDAERPSRVLHDPESDCRQLPWCSMAAWYKAQSRCTCLDWFCRSRGCMILRKVTVNVHDWCYIGDI